MDRDLRQTPLFQEVEAFYRKAFEPGFGAITGANDARPAPDGSAVAFTGTRLDELIGEPRSRICLADVRGGSFRQVTDGPNDDTHPRWSPDGTRLTFQSDRTQAGRSQLYVLEVAAPDQVTALPEVLGSIE
jgi:Tol biopolymer transport system component